MSDLIERLRNVAGFLESEGMAASANVCRPAADEIERLRRQNEALQGEVVLRAMQQSDLRRELAEAVTARETLRSLHLAAEKDLDKMERELAEVRGLLREATSHVNTHAFSSADRLAERIDAFLTTADQPGARNE